MNQLTAVVPFALVPPELANDLIRALQAPALAMLLGRHASHSTVTTDVDSRLLPHEAGIAQMAGAASRDDAPFAHAAMRALALPPRQGWWFIAQPVHLALNRTHMTLADPRKLQLDETDARALFDQAKPYFDDIGKTLLYGSATMWFLRADDWCDLRTASPDAAVEENVSDWMPSGTKQREFRKLQNEVQMLWHENAVNEARQQRGLAPVNAFWLWGGADSGHGGELPALATSSAPDWLSLLAQPALRNADVATVLAQPDDTIVVLSDALVAGKAIDWSPWLMHMQQLEQQWFAPLLDAVRGGRLKTLKLVLTSRTHTATFNITKGALRKFWRRPSLDGLKAVHPQ